ncbi:hypothetical protein CAEBREN_14691 [Caenorhabditis brenneri]|uniref:Uncharacterized protein n=1 Tax=Caenorhabditis brenneri TaxID=135651 RepID=G0MY74_CAEBE|nr:hypothetical protein CAEBREN_14691 [Caenorhabditis brenneri]
MAQEIEAMVVNNLREEELECFVDLWRTCRQSRLHLIQHNIIANERVEKLQHLEELSCEVVRLGLRPFSREESEYLLQLTDTLRLVIQEHNDILMN